MEQYFLDRFECNNANYGYNTCSNASSCLGKICSAETRAKISQRRKAYRYPENLKKEMSLSRRGVKKPDGFGERHSQIMKKRWADPIQRKVLLSSKGVVFNN
jgi:hypothetical protein